MMIPLVAENVEVPETEEAISLETENAEVFDDGQGPFQSRKLRKEIITEKWRLRGP